MIDNTLYLALALLAADFLAAFITRILLEKEERKTMKNKYLSIRTDCKTLARLDAIVNYANENLLPNQKKVNKTVMIESLIDFAFETMPKEDEGETLVGMSQEGNDEEGRD